MSFYNIEKKGVYGYGYLNDSDSALHAKEMVRHGDVSAMSIGARKLKKMGQSITHGMIYEVSLVLAGANPGAYIEHVMTHSDEGEVESDKAVIFTDMIIHSADTLPEDDLEEDEMFEEETDLQHADDDVTIGDVLGTLDDAQMEAVTALIANLIEEDGDEEMKQNVFAGQTEDLD